MPIRKIQFENEEFYHIFNRGVEKRDIFMNQDDYLRFIRDLYVFNDQNKIRDFSFTPRPSADGRGVKLKCQQFVDIVCFCLMPNHFHLLLRQITDQGIILFMRKLSGYSGYFNTKYERVGSLFQGRFKAVHIKNDEQLKHTSRYIHLNPLELIEPDWKEKGIKDWRKAMKFLEDYRRSSYLDYIGKENFPLITNREFITQYFDGKPEKYKKYVQEWVIDDFEKIETLE